MTVASWVYPNETPPMRHTDENGAVTLVVVPAPQI